MNMVTLSSQQHNSPLTNTPYLGDKEPPFPTINLPDPTRIRTTLAPIITTTNYNNRKSSEDDEIGVFRAEKYFNDVETTSSRQQHRWQYNKPAEARSPARINLEQVRARMQPRTPQSSAGRSETTSSSRHSRSVLLNYHNNNIITTTTTTTTPKKKKKFLPSGFGCNKCSDKNSVDIIDNAEPIIQINPRPASFRSEKTPGDLLRRRGSPDVAKTMSLGRRLIPWDRPQEIGNCQHDSGGSDASSDLFEIDSLTGKRADDPFRCETPTTTVYAPSEASIQWSVVTASDEDAATWRMRRGLLLGCKSQKAVNVAGPASLRADSPARFQAEIARINNNHSRFLFIN